MLTDLIDSIDLFSSLAVAEDRRARVRLLHKDDTSLDVLITPMSEVSGQEVDFTLYLKIGDSPTYRFWRDVIVEENGKITVYDEEEQTILPFRSEQRFPQRIVYHTVANQINQWVGEASELVLALCADYQERIETGKAKHSYDDYRQYEYLFHKEGANLFLERLVIGLTDQLNTLFEEEPNPSTVYEPSWTEKSLDYAKGKIRSVGEMLTSSARYFSSTLEDHKTVSALPPEKEEYLQSLEEVNPEASRFMRNVEKKHALFNNISSASGYIFSAALISVLGSALTDHSYAFYPSVFLGGELAIGIAQLAQNSYATSIYGTVKGLFEEFRK